MPRQFNSSSNSINCSVGAFSGAPFTYGMIVAILQWSAVQGWMEFYSNQVASGDLYAGIEISNNRLVTSFDGSTQCTSTFTPSQDVWYCIILTKVDGNANPRWNIYNYSTNTWTTSVADNACGNGAGNMGTHYIGSYQNGFEFFAGPMHAMGLFRQVAPSTDAEIQALGLHVSRNAWYQCASMADRAAFWFFDQYSTSVPVIDLTGGGANEASGTVPNIATISTPLFSYTSPVIQATTSAPAVGGPYTDDVNTTGTVTTDVTDVMVSTPKYKAQGSPTEQTSTGSVAWPTHVAGDIGILLIESTGGEAISFSNAQGFTELANSPSATGSGTAGTRISAYYCRATSSSMASPALNDPGNHWYGVILTFQDCIDSGSPIDVTAAAQKATASTSMTMPAVTTTVNKTLVLNVAARDNDNAAAAGSSPSNANLDNLTERFDLGTTFGNGGGIMVWSGEKATAGSTGTTGATVTSSINAYLTIALKGNQPATGTSYTDNVDTTIVGVTDEVDVRALTESVNTVIIGVTSVTDVVALNDTVQTVIVGVTTETDLLSLVETVDTTIVGVTNETDVRGLTESVDTVIVGVTDTTALLSLTETVDTVVVGVTNVTDVTAISESVTTVIVCVTDVVASLTFADIVQTVIVGVTSVTDIFSFNDNVVTTAVVVTPCTDVAVLSNTVQTVIVGVTDATATVTYNETLTTVIVGTTDLVDSVAMLSTVETVIVGVTNVADLFSYNENVQNIIVGTTTLTELLAVTESLNTTGFVTTDSTELAALSSSVETVIVGVTTQGDSLGILEQPVTTGTAVQDVTALLAMVESVETLIATFTSVVDQAVGTEVLETIINAVTSEVDVYNEGEPGEPILAYQAPPWKVIGYR